MDISVTILDAITGSVFGYALDQTGWGDKVREKIAGAPQQQAFQRALGQAFAEFAGQHQEWVANHFDASFFQHEGAPVLAQFLLHDGHPDPSDLAVRWANSLNIRDAERRTMYVRDLEPVAADFLDRLARILKAEPDLSELFDSRAFEQMAEDVAVLRAAARAGRATPGTRWDYLHWLIERNMYLDPRGVMQTQRQVQVKLDEVYVSLRAQLEETPGSVDKQLAAELQNLAEIRLAVEELEDRHEHLLARLEQRHMGAQGNVLGKPIELTEVVPRHAKLVILGDPGGGKTTLLRYLALKHAEALWHGQTEANEALGATRFPIFIRIADYAESGAWREQALSDFLAQCCSRLECPATGLADLLERELATGNCLVLLDGLDEIVSADERRGVVQQIESFVRRHDDKPNRFVITSRVAGYRSASLAPPFAHYMIQDMNEEQIQRFLERWCPAVEAAQTPELSPEVRQATAQREIDGVLHAIERTPGVQRLAANPLMLRILALIHRTGAQLPQKRIELYKLAADTLARTWRTAQGVPESALVKEEYLTRLLGKLAYWMHEHKPTGIATQREVYQVLGAEWAQIKRVLWDAEEPHPDIIEEVEKFLLAVREHTGLFVERAPQRYGFMHLTFEEYYAARHLVARSRMRAKLIRQHLHDPRWYEPILLALGFVGLDYPQEAGELLETAILAQGEEAEELEFAPSRHEDLLGRDYLFALRCLGDHIPTEPLLVQRLVERLANEWLHQHGSGKFRRYRRVLEERIGHLKESEAGTALTRELVDALRVDEPDVCVMAAKALGQLDQSSPEMISALVTALDTGEPEVRAMAAVALGQLRQSSPAVVSALVTALDADDPEVCAQAIGVLGQLGDAHPAVVSALVVALGADDFAVRILAAGVLGHLRENRPEVVSTLVAALGADDLLVRDQAARVLRQLGDARPEVVSTLVAALGADTPEVRVEAAGVLGQLGDARPAVVNVLVAALGTGDLLVRDQAVWVLGQLGKHHPAVVNVLVTALSTDDFLVRFEAARALGQLGDARPAVVDVLVAALGIDDPVVRQIAARALGKVGQDNPAVVGALMGALGADELKVRGQVALALGQLGESGPAVFSGVREVLVQGEDYWLIRPEAARMLGGAGTADVETMDVLWHGLLDDDDHVRADCAQALAQLGERFLEMAPEIEQRLIQAIDDPAFAKPDKFANRPGYDYAYDGLWMLVSGGSDRIGE